MYVRAHSAAGAADHGTKRDKPHWGARKIREFIVRRLAGDVRILARSRQAVLDRRGLVKRARARLNRADGTPLSIAASPMR
jgi:hypothetical protein